MTAEVSSRAGWRARGRVAPLPRIPLRRRVLDQLREEVDRVVVRPWRSQARPWTTASVAAATIIGIFVFRWANTDHAAIADRLSTIRASLPLNVELERLPLSVMAPTPHLPAWGAIAQVAVVFWLAELNLGRRLSLILIAVYHASATLAGRAMVQLGPHAPLRLGTDAIAGHIRDTGPSAAVVGLSIYLGIKLRTPLLCGLVILAMVAEAAWRLDLAGREHIVVITVAWVTALPLMIARRSARRSARATPDRAASRVTPA